MQVVEMGMSGHERKTVTGVHIVHRVAVTVDGRQQELDYVSQRIRRIRVKQMGTGIVE